MSIHEQQKERYSKETKDQVLDYLVSEALRIRKALENTTPGSPNRIILNAEYRVLDKMTDHLATIWGK